MRMKTTFPGFLGASFRGFLTLLLVIVAGCKLSSGPHSQTEEKIHAERDLAVNQNQIRLRMRSLVGPMCGQMEQSADSIIAGTTNRAVQRGALRWKIEGVPAMREALFQPDPFTAIMDAWVLCNQMADYFETGPGREVLMEGGAQAVATCRSMEEEFARIVATATISGDVSKARAFARQWAADHPIRHSIADRESTLSRVFDRGARDWFSAGEAVGEITTTVDDLNRRLEIYSDQLFRQARWEAELFKWELLDGLPVDQVIPLVERAMKSLEEATRDAFTMAENAPKLITSEREAAFRALQEELVQTLKFVQEERIAALDHLTRERIAALQDMAEVMAKERKILTQDIEQISLKTVDHAIWRIAQLVAATIAVLLLSALVGLFLIRWIFFQAPLSSPRGKAS